MTIFRQIGIAVSALLTAAFGFSPFEPAGASEPPAPTVRVAILVGTHGRHAGAAETLEAALKEAGHACVAVSLGRREDPQHLERSLTEIEAFAPTVIAAAGSQASALIRSRFPDVPLVFFMVPNALDSSLMRAGKDGTERLAGVAADVSPAKRLDWIRKLHPNCRRICVLSSPGTRATVAALDAEATRRGIRIEPIPTRKDAFAEAIDRLGRASCDAVVMLPDPAIYNTPNVQRLILWGLRHEKPVWTFSANIVKAGALGAQFVADGEVGREAAAVIEAILQGTTPGDIGLRYPGKTEAAVNEHTARSIGLSLERLVDDEVQRFGSEP